MQDKSVNHCAMGAGRKIKNSQDLFIGPDFNAHKCIYQTCLLKPYCLLLNKHFLYTI